MTTLCGNNMLKNKRSLDLGCHNHPRNPYQCAELFGVDLSEQIIDGVIYKRINLALEPIPFPDNYFDYVTAFDVLEHIPRQMFLFAESRLPFIELMNEIWRVLKPDGIFYAVTPAYPSASAFQDPTHINFITAKTHEYFCGEPCSGKMYGFTGHFETLRAEFVIPKTTETPELTLQKRFYHLQKRLLNPSRFSHFLWELQAKKSS